MTRRRHRRRRQQAAQPSTDDIVVRAWSVRRIAIWTAAGVLALVAAMILFVPSPVVNWLATPAIERAFSEEFPGYALRLGTLNYSTIDNRLVCDSIRIQSKDSSFSLTTSTVSVSGFGWLTMAFGGGSIGSSIHAAHVDVKDLDWRDPGTLYGVRCESLRFSMPDSEGVAESVDLYPLHGDEPFFQADPFRSTRYRLLAESFFLEGLVGTDLLEGKAFHSRLVTIRAPYLDVLVNKDKPNRRESKTPPMPNELLLSLAAAVNVDSIRIIDGQFLYGERFVVGDKPAWITFDSIQAEIGGITNADSIRDAIILHARWKLANAGLLQLSMSIPLEGPMDSFRFAGTLGSMDLSALNTFLEPSDQMRITRGVLEEASFLVMVDSGIARGHVRGIYRDLKVAVVDGQTGASGGLSKSVGSFIANTFVLRRNNAPDRSEPVKAGKVLYRREHDDTFINFVWFSVRMGVQDVLGS